MSNDVAQWAQVKVPNDDGGSWLVMESSRLLQLELLIGGFGVSSVTGAPTRRRRETFLCRLESKWEGGLEHGGDDEMDDFEKEITG